MKNKWVIMYKEKALPRVKGYLWDPYFMEELVFSSRKAAREAAKKNSEYHTATIYKLPTKE